MSGFSSMRKVQWVPPPIHVCEYQRFHTSTSVLKLYIFHIHHNSHNFCLQKKYNVRVILYSSIVMKSLTISLIADKIANGEIHQLCMCYFR